MKMYLVVIYHSHKRYYYDELFRSFYRAREIALIIHDDYQNVETEIVELNYGDED